jgi:ATP-dependent RNA helicase DeaD
VIHADMPQNTQMLVHRSGRTGRAGKRGTAILLVPDNARRYVDRMLQSAHVEAAWLAAPSSEAILARDGEQLVNEIATLEDVSDDDREVARALLAKRSAEDLVASLVRERRQARPAPEELTTPPSMRPQAPREPREHRPHAVEPRRQHSAEPREHLPRTAEPRRQHSASAVWFTINVGRAKNADPKWLVPLLCRRGQISKQDIGKIQILMRETRVEIGSGVSERFAAAVSLPDPKDRNIHIELLDAPS